MSIESFNLLLLVMGLVALVVFIALYFVRAGYGMFRSRSWGISVNNKIAWIVVVAFRPTFFTCRTHFLSFFPTTLLPKGFCFSFPDERKEQDAGTHSFDGSDL